MDAAEVARVFGHFCKSPFVVREKRGGDWLIDHGEANGLRLREWVPEPLLAEARAVIDGGRSL